MRYQPQPVLAPNGHTDIIAKLESASGPDRELDCLITCAIHPTMRGEWHEVGPPTYDPKRFFSGQPGMDWIGYDLLNNAPKYTASLDAALALVAEKLPGWSVLNLAEWDHAALRERGQWMAQLGAPLSQEARAMGGIRPMSEVADCRHAPTAPLAVLLALFRALSGCEGHGTEQSSGAGQASGSAPNPTETKP